MISEGKIADKPPTGSRNSLAAKKSVSGIAQKDIPKKDEEPKTMSDALKNKPPSWFGGGLQKSFIGAKKSDLLDESPSTKPKPADKAPLKSGLGGLKAPTAKGKDLQKQSFIEPPLKSSFVFESIDE